MPLTSPWDIAYPDTGDPANLSSNLALLAESTNDALNLITEDTGWVPITILPGYAHRGAGYSLVRRKSGIVYVSLQMDMTVGDWTSVVNFANMPVGFRPDPAINEIRWLGFRTTRSSVPVGGYMIASSGNITFQPSGQDPVTPAGHFSVLMQPYIAAGF